MGQCFGGLSGFGKVDVGQYVAIDNEEWCVAKQG